MSDVLITTNTLGYGGAERQRVRLANGLAERGHSVHLVALQSLGPLQTELAPAVRCSLIPNLARLPTRSEGATLISGTTNTEVTAAAVWRFARRGGRRRWLVAAHTPAVGSGRTYGRLLHTLIPRADGLLGLSQQHLVDLQQAGRLNRQCFVIPNGIVPGPSTPISTSAEELRFVFVGRLAPQKGLDMLLDALPPLLDEHWRLDVHGDGPEFEPLRQQADAAGLKGRVAWHGYTDVPREVIADADVLVLPSRGEAFPLTVLEAMSVERPVIATPVGSVPEMLDGGRCGWLVPFDPTSWSGALRKLIHEPRTRLQVMGSAGRQRVQALYTEEAMIDGYERAIAHVHS